MTDITLREADTELDLDHFDAQATAFARTWAEVNRQRYRALDTLDDERREHAATVSDYQRDIAIANARIIELERSNAQLHERVGESMSREALAHAEAARLAGIMTVTGNSLADGMAKAKTATPPTFLRPRPVA